LEYLGIGIAGNVRQSVRNALKGKPMRFEDREKTFNHLKEILDLGFNQWLSVSKLLTNRQKQKDLKSFV